MKTTPTETATHTPGPWEVDQDESGCSIRSVGKGYLLARLSAKSFTYGADLPDGPPHDIIANANLMAAAPVMFAVLQAMSGDASAYPWHRSIRAAIAKAEGK